MSCSTNSFRSSENRNAKSNEENTAVSSDTDLIASLDLLGSLIGASDRLCRANGDRPSVRKKKAINAIKAMTSDAVMLIPNAPDQRPRASDDRLGRGTQ